MGATSSATPAAPHSGNDTTAAYAIDPLVAYTDTQSILAHSFVAESSVSVKSDCLGPGSTTNDTLISTDVGSVSDEEDLVDMGYDGDTDDYTEEDEDVVTAPRAEACSPDRAGLLRSYENRFDVGLLRWDSLDGMTNSSDYGCSGLDSSQDHAYLCNPLTHDVNGNPLAAMDDALFASIASSSATYMTGVSRVTSLRSSTVFPGRALPRHRKRDKLRELLGLRRKEVHGDLRPRSSARKAALAVLRHFPCFVDR
jgi:hypothetical protein